MRLIIVSLVSLVAFIGFVNAGTQSALFTKYCAEEGQLKQQFDSLVFNRYERSVKWDAFMAAREKRIKWAKENGFTECPLELNPGLVVPTDEELFEQLCAEEKQLRSDARSFLDEEARYQVEQIEQDTRKYRTAIGNKLKRKECPATIKTGTILSGADKISAKLYYESCRQLIFYEHFSMMCEKIVDKISHPSMTKLALQAQSRFHVSNTIVGRHCNGFAPYCCGKELYDAYRLKAPVEEVDMIVKAALAEPIELVTVNGKEPKEDYDKNACEIIRKVEKIYSKEADKRDNNGPPEWMVAPMREQLRQAAELLSAKRHELKARCGTNYRIFKNLG